MPRSRRFAAGRSSPPSSAVAGATSPRLHDPRQIDGGMFLARGDVRLADEPRVGKTGASVIGMHLLMARRVLVTSRGSNGQSASYRNGHAGCR